MGNPIHKCGTTTQPIWTQETRSHEFEIIGKQSFVVDVMSLYCPECETTVPDATELLPWEHPVMDEAAQAVYDQVHAENPWLPSFR